jgi:hypothetical protein
MWIALFFVSISVHLIIDVDCQAQAVKRPEDLFPDSPIYVPPFQNEKKAPNPFRDTFGREHPDTLFLGIMVLFSVFVFYLKFEQKKYSLSLLKKFLK